MSGRLIRQLYSRRLASVRDRDYIGKTVIDKVRSGIMRAKTIMSMLLVAGFMVGIKSQRLDAAESGAEWQRVVAAAKKEGKVVIGAPPGNDFRNEVQALLKKRFD